MVEEERDDTARPVRLVPSFDAFYLEEFPSMVTLAYAVSRSRTAAEDLAQEAMIRAHRNWDRIAAFDKPGAWVRRVTYNLSVSALRRATAEAKAVLRLGRRLDPVPEPEPGFDAKVWEAIHGLPARQRAAVILFYLEDRSAEEVGEILGCSRSAATSHLHKARRSLADALGPEYRKEWR